MAEIEVKNLKEAQEKIDELLKLDPSTNRPSTEEIEVAAKEFVDAAYAFSTKLFEIGTENDYKIYLDTIFPDSKINQIMFHKTTAKKFDEFKLKKKSPSLGNFFFFFILFNFLLAKRGIKQIDLLNFL